MSGQHILITGLRRSGTTILWETLRQNPRIVAFDEPFHPQLHAGDRTNAKGTWTEIKRVLHPEGLITPIPITPEQELDPDLSDAHCAYFSKLLASSDQVVVDVVRCWNHVPGFYPSNANILTVHLVRDPRSWVQGHLLPTGAGTIRKVIGDRYRKLSFFSRRGFFNNYHYQQIIDAALAANHPMWRFCRMPVEELKAAPAFLKLVAFWWCTNLTTHHRLSEFHGVSQLVTLGDFSRAPGQTLGSIEASVSGAPYDYDLRGVRPVRDCYRGDDPRWLSAAEAIGMPKRLMTTSGNGATAIRDAFDTELTRHAA